MSFRESYCFQRSFGELNTSSYFLGALKQCTLLRDLKRGKEIHSQALEAGLASNSFLATTLINMYAKCGEMLEAKKVFDKLNHPDVVSWTALILGYVDNGESRLALEIYDSIRGCTQDSRIYVAALTACASLASKEKDDGEIENLKLCLEKGKSIHSQAVANRCSDNIFVGNTLVDMYGKCGDMTQARKVFDGMRTRDRVSWNALLQGYVENEQSELALKLFNELQDDIVPDSRTYVAALSACASLASRAKAPEKRRWFDKGRSIHARVTSSRCCNIYVENTLVDMYSKAGRVTHAKRVFDRMKRRDVVSWTALITGYVVNERNEEALELVPLMDVTWNYATFVAIFTACGNLMALETGREFHVEVRSLGLDRHLVVAGSLIDFYGKCGSTEDAKRVFDSLPRRTTVSYTSLMRGYGLQGDTQQVLELFERMEEQGLKPDRVTLACVLSACSYSGMTYKGREMFELMEKKYGVARDLVHYTCMIDLLGRANLLSEAMKMLREMPYEPDVVTWTAVLGACRKWNEVELGRTAYESMVRLEEEDAASYVLMAGIFEAEGTRKGYVAPARRGRTCWVDGEGKTHTFVEI